MACTFLMMKIGIVTQPLHTNYGGLLQNYALQQILKRMGHEVVTMDQEPLEPFGWRIYASNVKTFILHCIRKGNHRVYSWQRRLIRKNTDRFINQYITHSEVLKTYRDFLKYTQREKIGALVVGSDQVWRPMYNKNILRSFLDFSEKINVVRLAYAASFGVDYWEFTSEQTSRCQELLKQFDAVSVREDSGVDLCKKYLECEVMHVLDPTMLLDRKDYMALVHNEHELVSKGNLFTYILDESIEKQRVIQQVASSLELIPFSIMPLPLNRQNTKNIEQCVYPSVTQWIRSFMDAEYVICDSFHGAVFSIIFNKPFLVIGNKERGMSRFTSLLKMFDLNDRMIDADSDDLSMIETPIDWIPVNARRAFLKEQSVNFIINALK